MLLISGILLAAGAASFSIPAGQPEGVYSVTTDAAGVETHTFIKLYDPDHPTPKIRDLIASVKFSNKR